MNNARYLASIVLSVLCTSCIWAVAVGFNYCWPTGIVVPATAFLGIFTVTSVILTLFWIGDNWNK